MSLQSHIEVLKERHASLDTRIHEEDCRPRPDESAVSAMQDRAVSRERRAERAIPDAITEMDGMCMEFPFWPPECPSGLRV